MYFLMLIFVINVYVLLPVVYLRNKQLSGLHTISQIS